MNTIIRTFFFCSAFSASILCSSFAQDTKPADDKAPVAEKKQTNAEIKFDVLEHDYGTIKKGGNGVYEFSFKNIGTEPLIITSVHGSCGCTVPESPKEPILPGATNKIKVSYDTQRVGGFTKTVTVNTNGKTEIMVLTIKGTVAAPPKEETFPINKTEDGATPFASPSQKSKF